jgi:uncharacterized integral membrane protein
MADGREPNLEDRATRALNRVMFWVLGVGVTALIGVVLVVRIRAATSPVNFLQTSWQYVLGAVVLAVWGVVAVQGGVRQMRRDRGR